MNNISKKIVILFLIIIMAFAVFLVKMLYNTFSTKNAISPVTVYKRLSRDGSIISSDGYYLSVSQNLYRVYINTKSLNPNKINEFVSLYTLYTGEKKVNILRKIRSKKGFVLLSNNITLKTATQLKQLNKYLIKNRIFLHIDINNGEKILYAVATQAYKSGKYYPYNDLLSNVIGYTKNEMVNKIIDTKAVTGLEKNYEPTLSKKQDEIIIAKKNVSGYLMYSKGTKIEHMINGHNIVLSINAKMQNRIENIIDEYNKKIDSNEIIVSLMDSKTGDIMILATTKRYNLNNIKQSDVSNGNINNDAIIETYEPGSVTKPIILSTILTKDRKLTLNSRVNINHGYYKINGIEVRDKIYYKDISVANIIAMSSNIGISRLSLKLSKKELYNTLTNFGFGSKTGIDLPNEARGEIKYYNRISDSDRVVMSFGYAFTATFMQMLRAYNVFNDNGYIVEPSIAKYIVDSNNHKILIQKDPPRRIVSNRVIAMIRKALKKTVKTGTAKKTYIPSLIIGGKTGTAKIAKNGKYTDMHNSSFFGFVNDKHGHKYTIGVLIKKSMNKNYQLSSKSTIPLVKKVILSLVYNGYLKEN